VGPIGPVVEIHSGRVDTIHKADRWGVTCSDRLDPNL